MKLLLATYNFPPDSYGGSEVYVESLAAELLRAGHNVAILCGTTHPPRGPGRFEIECDSRAGIPVWRFHLDGARFTMAELYTTSAADLQAFWKDWLSRNRPDVLHIQGHTLAVSHSLMEAAKDLGIPVMFTLHNVPELCPHGDFITWRGVVCDGRAELLKCARCVGSAKQGPALGLAMAAATPLLSRWRVPASSQWPSWRSTLHYPGLLRLHLEAQEKMLAMVDRWHVFSEWSRHALETNGASPQKITLLRHTLMGEATPSQPRPARGAMLRLGFFGRFNAVKGVPVLLDAIHRLPDAPLRLEIFGAAQHPAEATIETQVKRAATGDPRIVWRGRIAHAQQPAALANLDVVVVPSLWIETGPLTVLEAFAAGVPVVGSDLSGINEWVKEGRNGWLFPHGDSAALAGCLAKLCANPSLVNAANDFPEFESVAAHAGKVMRIYDSMVA